MHTGPMAQPKNLETLQVLRALAAMAVMTFHGAEILELRAGHAALGPLFAPGHHGVDLFFVLSGFIIRLTGPRAGGARPFLGRRFVRLFPVYWLVTGLLLIAYAAAPRSGMAHKGDLGVIVQSVLLLPAPRHVVGVAWTLVYEVWFYALFGLLWFRSRTIFYGVLVGWCAVDAVALWVLAWRPESHALRTLLNPILCEFLLGCLAAEIFVRVRGRAAAPAFALGAGAFAAAWLAALLGARLDRVVAFGVPSVLLVYGGAGLRVRWPRALVAVGDASYSLYLIHGTAISALLTLAAQVGFLECAGGGLGSVVIYALTLSSAIVFHRLVEAPLLSVCRQRWLEPRAQLPVPSPALPA
jgi:exopolysaccharide production protein ExoZ